MKTKNNTYIQNQEEREVKLHGHRIRKESLEKVTLTRHIECKSDSVRQQTTYPTVLCEWIAELGLRKK